MTWETVALVGIGIGVAVLFVDYRRWLRDRQGRLEARRRHPAFRAQELREGQPGWCGPWCPCGDWPLNDYLDSDRA